MSKNKVEILKELANVVSKNKVKSIQIIGEKNQKNRVDDFYERLLNNEFTNDIQAAHQIYEEDPHNAKYRKLRNRLKDKLINTSFFIDTSNPKFSTHQRAFYTCQKNLIAVKILLGRYARNAAIELATETLKKSLRFELSEVTFELSKLLRNHYSMHDQNIHLYKKYFSLAEEHREIVEVEELLQKAYDETSILLRKETNTNLVIRICSEVETKNQELLKTFQSYRIHLLYYFLILRKYSLLADYKAIVSLCNRAIDFFESKNFVSKHFVGTFYYNKLMALIQLRDFSHGRILVEKCIGFFEEDTFRWFKAFQISFIFSLHDRKYNKALSLREKVVNSVSFRNQMQTVHEIWILYDAYLHYLLLRNKITVQGESSLSSFRIKRFLNELPVFARNKTGTNVPILIIQILMLISNGKYDHLMDRIDAIEKYSSRYLRRDDNYRSNCFIKMLLQIPKQGFHRLAVERHAEPYLKKLHAMPLESAKQPFEIEIIPYETLWELALESLDRRKLKK